MSLGEIAFWTVAASVPTILLTYSMYMHGISEAVCWKEPNGNCVWPLDVFPLWLTQRVLTNLYMSSLSLLGSVCFAYWWTISFLGALGIGASVYLVSLFISFLLLRRWTRLHPKQVELATRMQCVNTLMDDLMKE